MNFDLANYPWKAGIDYRKNPHLYKIGRGQQGVLVCEPYKNELHPHWKFRTPEIAQESAEKIYSMFLDYLKYQDFVGADMAKKYLHMGFTRSRRYANHKSGKKWSNESGERKILPQEKDWASNLKAESAKVFHKYWIKARQNEIYLELRKKHIEQ
jgi:hypothetical protein